jgi:hypothetical protein
MGRPEYPYQAAHTNVPSSDQALYVAVHMNSAQHANCISCHFVGDFPVQRGKEDLQKMAPNLGNVSRRLRPEWTKAWLTAPMNWLPYSKMLTLWPIRTVRRFRGTDRDHAQTEDRRADRALRDFLYALRPDTVWRKRRRATSPVVQGGVSEAESAGPSAAAEKPTKGKVIIIKKPPPKKHGSIEPGGTTG